MSDTTTSGDNTTPVAPAETANAPAQPDATTAQAPASPIFGSSRGSGLARGKRATNSATNSQPATAGDYKPTAIQVVNNATEFQNPFAPAEPTPAPAAEKPVESKPAVIATPAPVVTATPAPEKASDSDVKPELNILPPEEKPRHAQSWQSDSFPAEQGDNRRQPRQAQGDERPVFQPRGQYQGNRDRNQRRDGRDRRDNPAGSQTPAVAPAPAPAPAPEKKKSKGFIGWLKGLFGSSDAETQQQEKPQTGDRNDRRNNREGGRRHHRGGRDRNRGGYRGENRGGENRDSGTAGGEYHPHNPSERRFDRGDRGDRGGYRRNRGGRDRNRGDRGPSAGGENTPQQ